MQNNIHLIIFVLSTLFGLAFSQSKDSVLSRGSRAVSIKRTNAGAVEESEVETITGDMTEENQSLPAEDREANSPARSRTVLDPEAGPLMEGSGMSLYYNFLNTLYAVYRPLLTKRFLDALPKAVVCILAGKDDCGLEAELTKSISTQIDKILRPLLTSMKSMTCQNLAPSSRSFLASNLLHFWLDESTLAQIAAIQDMLLSTLVHLPQPYSEYLMTAWSVFSDAALTPAVTYISDFIVKLLETPINYFRIGLQFVIEIPVLNESEQCQQGGLKQLIMWGMTHNVSWSFGSAMLDVLLAPEPPPCGYSSPDCQNIPYIRSLVQVNDGSPPLLSCEHRRLASFNNTLCANMLRPGPGDSPTLYSLCQALSSLTPSQLELVWTNGCGAVSSILAPLLDSSSCGGNSHPASRVSRSTLSLNDLMCIYSNWTGVVQPDPNSVAFCADNDRESFLLAVCGNIELIHLLVIDPANSWLLGFCANISGDHMATQQCSYETWRIQMVDASVLSFCWEQDRERMEYLLCHDLNFFMHVLNNPQNSWLSPNCTNHEPPKEVKPHCAYSEWQDPAHIPSEMVTACIQYDPHGFLQQVCANSTFLNALLLNEVNDWVGDYCTLPPFPPPTEPPSTSSTSKWCNYDQWPRQVVDPSVVGLCWHNDQVAFHRNVCCNMPLFEKLTLDPQNEWLMAVCGDEDTLDTLHERCPYSDWSRPTIVDTTDLAFCAELDPNNFTLMVCTNEAVLQNLLANLDNTWVLQYCSSHSGWGAGGGGGDGGGGLIGFKPADQCRYSSWAVALPGASLLALCWDYDLANFVSSICSDSTLLALLTREPSSTWVGTLCNTYTNNMTGNGASGNGNGGNSASSDGGNSDAYNNGTDPQPCPARDLIQQLNWTCSTDLSTACRPGASHLDQLQLLMRCGAEALGPHMGRLLSDQMVSVMDQAASVTVVLLMALEESRMTSLHITENLRLSILDSVMLYLEQETNFTNKRVLLQCFGKVLTSLMQTGRDATSSDDFFLIKEYFRIPLPDLSAVLSAVDITTIRQIMQYYSRNLETLQLTEEYQRTMVSVLFGTHLTRDGTLFPYLAPLLALLPPNNILSLPNLQSSTIVLSTIDASIFQLSPEQRRAFGKWLGKFIGTQNLSAAGPSFIRDTGNLIAYLPFRNFQHLSPAQLLDGLDVLLRNTLSPTQGQFVAQTLVGTYGNLSADFFMRLGNLTCLAKPKDLLAHIDTNTMAAILANVKKCVHQGMKVPSDMISSLFLNGTDLQSPSSLSPERISQLGDFLPFLGVDFLVRLTPAQLRPALPALATVPFTPNQAQVIVEKVLSSSNVSVRKILDDTLLLSVSRILVLPGQLLQLGTLVSGVKVETLWTLTSDGLLAALPNIALHSPGLSPPQANAITTKLWGSEKVTEWLDKVEPLLSSTPLLSVKLRAPRLLTNISSVRTRVWNMQQAKALFKEAVKNTPELSMEEFLALGTVAQGANCETLRSIFLSQPSLLLQDVLALLKEQPVLLHTSLKKCVIEELYQFDFFSQLLGNLGSQFALELSLSTIHRFPVSMMDTFRKMIVQDPLHFLRIPKIKQALLVDKIVQRLNMFTGWYSEEEFRSLGVMATFVEDEMFARVDRTFFIENLEFLRGFCYSSSKRDLVAEILQEPGIFGPVNRWTSATLDQVDRFLFFLPREAIQKIPVGLMTLDRIERLFLNQLQWEAGEFGTLCMQSTEQAELLELFTKRQLVLQLFLGFLRTGPVLRTSPPVPSCENLHAMQPSAWPVDSLTAMSSSSFSSCLELIGRDPFLKSYELYLLLSKVKKIYGPASAFSPSVISQLGLMANQLTDEELAILRLSHSSIAALGSIRSWNSRQLSVLFLSMLNSTRQTPSQLGSSTMVALGHIVCGIKIADMRNLNAVEFSKAVLWLGHLRLSCSEEQLLVLVELLSHSLAFGPISSWGSDVFIEIGVLAAGLPDMAMSALVKDQIEGITPLAISLIPADKFSVVFHQAQIGMFSYEQAVAVTEDQRAALTPVQQTALSMVLNAWENKPVDFRGRSSGFALRPGPFSLLMELLMLMLLFFRTSF